MSKTMQTTEVSPAATPDPIRTGLSAADIAHAFRDHLRYQQGRFPAVTTRNDRYMALAYAVRDRLLHRWVNTAQTYLERESRTVCYLSAEFLMGPQLGNNLINLGLREAAREAMQSEGFDLDDILEQEEEPGLGNGGLGRLAACYLDSLATLEIPSIGYGIRYEFGIFEQTIRDGWQVEITDKWLRLGNPWEIPRPEIVFDVKLGGHTEPSDDNGTYRVRWVPDRVVRGMAYDTPVLGYKANTANLLRLWKAEAVESFDFQSFNTGDYYGAVLNKVTSENITKVLYPNDESPQGKRLRLEQQYFFASCALQDMIRISLQRGKNLDAFDKKWTAQLNDTHPSIAVAELMRLLVDEHQMAWDTAWQITKRTFAYTNHTLLPEALERWSIPLFSSVLPRHLEIIYEMNRRFLDQVRATYPDDNERIARMSLIDEHGDRYVRMANLACVGSQAVNGVAKLHSDLLKEGVLKDFYEWNPKQFTNVTNGVTPRRFLLLSNPRLANLITRGIGDGWIKQLDDLRKLEPLADDKEFRREWREVKQANKSDLAKIVHQRIGVELDPESLFDIQAKRLHEYKRQHLNLLHVISLYNRLKKGAGSSPSPLKGERAGVRGETVPQHPLPPRSFIFAGKAAPGYYMAKLIIKLINAVAAVVNNDPETRDHLRVAFFPNFSVKNAQHIYPAADLSEQISTAGKEASGTGNMKFAMNGALTIGTLDGANVEIREQVGSQNFFLFGLDAPEVQELKTRGYRPWDYYDRNPALKEVIDQIHSGFFSPENPGLFRPLVDSLLLRDDFLVFADFAAYAESQEQAGQAYLDVERWTKMSILNVARIGYFSSDRAIAEYCKQIWRIAPVAIELGEAKAAAKRKR